MNTLATAALTAFIILITVFLVAREIVCWYWKLNEIIEVLRSIDSRLPGALPDNKEV